MSEFSNVYGKALFELAVDENKCDEYFEELLKIDEILKVAEDKGWDVTHEI